MNLKISADKLETALNSIINIEERNIEKFGFEFPRAFTVDGKYDFGRNFDWTEGFWTGIMWLLYEKTQKPVFKEVAEKNIISLKERIEAKAHVDHHDMGFLYSLSCVAGYKLTGNAAAREAALLAAENLRIRFEEKGQYINVWRKGNLTGQSHFYIIDCLMNIPILFWATDETGDEKYRDVALRHLKTTRETIFREDYSTYHRFRFYENGERMGGDTVQGAGPETCWSRGQAWAIYGFALNYRYTKNQEDLQCAINAANYFLDNLPDDKICYWDFSFKKEDGEERDASAAAITVCGLMEIIKYLPEGEERSKFEKEAFEILTKLMSDEYAVTPDSGVEGLILHCTGSKPHNISVDTCTIYGDYFYVEALVRAMGEWELYW